MDLDKVRENTSIIVDQFMRVIFITTKVKEMELGFIQMERNMKEK
jgi:hypothetical protein